MHARFLLNREGLAVGRVRHVHNCQVPRNEIVAASPRPGTRLRGRATVDLLVSSGCSSRRLLMPDLRRGDASAAEDLLESAGLKVGRRIWPGARKGLQTVREQTPPPGYPIEEGGTVELITGW